MKMEFEIDIGMILVLGVLEVRVSSLGLRTRGEG